MVTVGNCPVPKEAETPEEEITTKKKEKEKLRHLRFLDYGSTNEVEHWSTCPTCQGIGRIPRGQQNQLVAVIPCSDQRLKPRHTKLYVCISVVVCLLVCSLFLFFLFPRSITLSPMILQSAVVFFTPTTVEMSITNVLNISNENFVTVEVNNLNLQVLIYDTMVGKTKLSNVTTLLPRKYKAFSILTHITVEDAGLKLTIKVLYLSHTEQLSMETYEYIDCGANTTIPHSPL